jgi:hypothetical protein
MARMLFKKAKQYLKTPGGTEVRRNSFFGSLKRSEVH